MSMAFEFIRLERTEGASICREGDALSANARALGSFKADEFKSHNHTLTNNTAAGTYQAGPSYNLYYQPGTVTTNSTGAAETAPKNVALYPRLRT